MVRAGGGRWGSKHGGEEKMAQRLGPKRMHEGSRRNLLLKIEFHKFSVKSCKR